MIARLEMDRGNRVNGGTTWLIGAVAGLVALVVGVLSATPASPVVGGAAGQSVGAITGRVTLTDPPEPRMVAVTTDQTVCGTEVEDQAVVVDGSGGLANAVVLVGGVPWSGAPLGRVHQQRRLLLPSARAGAADPNGGSRSRARTIRSTRRTPTTTGSAPCSTSPSRSPAWRSSGRSGGPGPCASSAILMAGCGAGCTCLTTSER